MFDSNVYYGWDFSNDDNKQYLSPIPASAGTGSNVVFSLENMLGSDDATTLGDTQESTLLSDYSCVICKSTKKICCTITRWI